MQVTVDQVKSLVTIPEGTLSDEDITSTIQGIMQINSACASVCRRVSTFYASNTDVSGGGGVGVQGSQASRQWLYLARDFEQRVNSLGGAPVVNGASPGSAIDYEQFDNNGGRSYDA